MRVSRPRLFLFSLAASFGAWSATIALLRVVSRGELVFAAAYPMNTYPKAHPYAFVGVVSVAFACVAATVGPAVARLSGGRRVAAIVSIVVGAVVVAGIPGGLLYTAFDVQAGFVPPAGVLLSDLMRNALNGLALGPLVAAASVPFSVLALLAGMAVVEGGLRVARVGGNGGRGPER